MPPAPDVSPPWGGRRLRLAAINAASLVVLIGLWALAASLAHTRSVPSPLSVATFLVEEARSGALEANIAVTLGRVAASFALAMTIGTAIGLWLGRMRKADRVFSLWLLVLLNTPALVIAVLCYIWLGLTDTAAVLAVALNKLPMTAVTVREGARAFDPGLDEMATAYRLPFGTWLHHVAAPQLAPYLAAAARNGIALVWKIVLLVELLGRPDGVGAAISLYFQLFDVRAVIGYAVAFGAVMLTIEFLVLQPLESHARRWRIDPA
ncbi:ABC transporter permease [Segnochrobactrum spirostomi]|uniref:ABC transporter permease subunit n=1 Tax=Segnochrobactrum spirostomi TaxID=2608987 RepID=A0A6A7Y8E0_9HYPH|nr:ABC transporter permease subunit [Segnochrobactrum spirostomi]MQT15563.1 ABC transporter permease subunit [Segnochrobactrum spirostomi]